MIRTAFFVFVAFVAVTFQKMPLDNDDPRRLLTPRPRSRSRRVEEASRERTARPSRKRSRQRSRQCNRQRSPQHSRDRSYPRSRERNRQRSPQHSRDRSYPRSKERNRQRSPQHSRDRSYPRSRERNRQHNSEHRLWCSRQRSHQHSGARSYRRSRQRSKECSHQRERSRSHLRSRERSYRSVREQERMLAREREQLLTLENETTDFQDNLINGYRALIADIQVRTQKSREDMDTLVSQIKLLMKNEADKAINYMTVYLEQISLYFQVIIHDRKPRNGTYCKESIVKLLGENLQLADENVTLCLALGYQRVQRLPEKLQVHFETLENLKKYSASKLFECQKQQQVGGNCSHESQDLERTVFLYETSPFPVVMAEIAIHGFKEVSDLSVCLKDIISRMMTHSVKVIGDFNRCIHNIEMPKLKYLLKFMKKYA